MHNKATVMYIWQNMLPRLSLGSQLLDTFMGLVFCVARCDKMSLYYQLVKLCVSPPKPCILLVLHIDWLNLCWKLLFLCCTESKPGLPYLDQWIPTTMNLKVPQSWTETDILFCKVATNWPMEGLRPLLVNAYWTILKRSQLLWVFSQF
jgi:hypothetical protein